MNGYLLQYGLFQYISEPEEKTIAAMIIRNIEEDLKIRLAVRASQHGRSLEEEVYQILRSAVTETSPKRQRLGSRIAARFAGIGLHGPLPELHPQTIEPMGFVE